MLNSNDWPHYKSKRENAKKKFNLKIQFVIWFERDKTVINDGHLALLRFWTLFSCI